MKKLYPYHMISNGEKIGIVSYLTAALLCFCDIRLSTIPLTLFILLCAAAPFFYNLSFFLTIVTFGNTKKNAVSLTFDDGPDPESTPGILRLLSKYNVKAAFFVVGTKAEKHPELIREILSKGHEIGNHSYSHDNLIMLKTNRILKKEIESCQTALKKFGIISFAFRAPVGITNPKLGSILSKSGLFAVNFRWRPGDGGNRWIKNLCQRVLKKIRPDDIIVLHDAVPAKKEQFSYWINQIDLIISGIQKNGFTILPLSELTGKKVMIKL
ncbi:polysaccharide deacetylase family protein [Desulfobacterales bacterium HSG17]|nr:polysaccharide deacetylase family protein [Desulfobacterales bacterium HSG17]